MTHTPADFVTVADQTDMSTVMQTLLDCASGLFAADRFDRVGIVHGSATHDCVNQLTLRLVRLYATSPFTQSRSSPSTRAVVPAIDVLYELTGCYTALLDSGKAPKIEQVASEAKALADDANLLFRGLVRQAAAGVLLEGVAYERFTFGEVAPALGATGGVGAYQLPLQITLG